MPSSWSRKMFRLQTAVNRKSSVTRWMGSITVRVIAGRLGSTPCTQLKASEGAERSSRRRRGKRKGQRRKRSLARASPSLEIQPSTRTSDMSARWMRSHLRACDHFYDRVQQFGKRLGQSKIDFSCPHTTGGKYTVWKARWAALSARIQPYGEGVVWCSRIGPSFAYYLEQQHGIVVGGSPSANRVLHTMLDGVVNSGEYLTANPPPSTLNQWSGDDGRCACKMCRTSILCMSSHGMGPGERVCRFCGESRHDVSTVKRRFPKKRAAWHRYDRHARFRKKS